jgi:hypothetical protein
MTEVIQIRKLKRHPIRGFLGGLLLGVGAVILLSLSGGGAFTAWWPFAVIAGGCAALGVALALIIRAR